MLARLLLIAATLLGTVYSSPALSVPKTLVCAHHQLCNLTLKLLDESERDNITTAFQSENSDPHEVALSPELLKIYYEAKNLILPAAELSPWLPTVIQNRTSENTFIAEVSTQQIVGKYPGAHAHFWLYENEMCALAQNLKMKLSSWGHKVRDSAAECSSARFQISAKKIKTALRGQYVILTHNALAPLLESLGIEFIILKTVAHAHEISPGVFKEVHSILDNHDSVLWLVESEVGLPPQLAKLIRETDHKIVVKVSGHFGQSTFAPLKELSDKLTRLFAHE